MRLIDLTGRTFGKWKVIRRVRIDAREVTLWECWCECGNLKHVYSCHLLQGNSKSCGCDIRKGRRHKQWRGFGDINGNYWDSIKRGAAGKKGNRRVIPFEITMEYAWNLFLEQDGKCALSGIPIVNNYRRKTGPPHTASIDRIDSSLGYIEGNIQWVHKDVNMMKRTYMNDYFIETCKLIAKNTEAKSN